MKRALVTGATGFVGGHMVETLLASGVEVRGTHRGEAPAGTREGLSWVHLSDLTDAGQLANALRGVDTVIHLAARVHVMRESESDLQAAFRRVNVQGTRVLLTEAVRANVASFVFASSVKAIGEGGAETLTESTPARPADAYGASKLEAEELVQEFALREGLHAPILRLPLVYGPGVGGNMLRLFKLVDRETPLPLGAVRNRRSMLYVGNAVASVLAILQTAERGSEVFLVSDGEDLSTPTLIKRIAFALNRRSRLIPVPETLFRRAGQVGDWVSKVTPVPLNSASVDRLFGSLTVDIRRIQERCGYIPRYTVTAGLELTAEWFRASRQS